MFYHTIAPLYIWILAVNGVPYIGFSRRSEADLMLGSSRLAGFGPLRTRGTMTTSLCERSHGGHVTQKRLLHDSEHASTDPVREK